VNTRSRQVILDVLKKYGETNITRLARLTGLHYRVLVKELKRLIEEGYVEERRFGRLRLFKLREK
jgi:predicted transcriptional regulator